MSEYRQPDLQVPNGTLAPNFRLRDVVMRARGQRWCVVCVLMGAIALASAVQAQQSKSDPSSDAATRQYAVAVGFQNQKLYDSAIDEWKTFLRFPF